MENELYTPNQEWVIELDGKDYDLPFDLVEVEGNFYVEDQVELTFSDGVGYVYIKGESEYIDEFLFNWCS